MNHGSTRSGQSLIESCLVVALICLVFFGVFQVSQAIAARQVLDYAAARGVRARTVGFNRFMIEKTVRVGAIPNAGRLVNPPHEGGAAQQHALEAPRIPLYLGGENAGRLRAILDYEDWHTIEIEPAVALGDGTLRLEVHQELPLRQPFHRAFHAADSLLLKGEGLIENHASLYMDDAGW